MTNLTVHELQQAEWSLWDEWLACQRWGSPFSTAWWLDANCRALGGHPLVLGVFDGEKLTGGVALRVMTLGPVLAARSSLLYNPVVIGAGGMRGRQQALGTLLEEMVRRRLVVPPLTCTPDMVDLRQAVWHRWNLTASWTVLTSLKTWGLRDSVSQSERANTRKAQRAGVTASVEPPDPDVLYDLMEASMSRQGQGARLTREQLRILVKGAGIHGIQTVARSDNGTPLSAGFNMAHGTLGTYDVWSGTSEAGRAVCADVARRITLLQGLQAMGYEYLDWCGANLPGVSDYKLEFGGTLTVRLAISREPLWFRAAFPAYARLSELKGVHRSR